MAESMKGLHRTHRCTEVSNQNIGETVTVTESINDLIPMNSQIVNLIVSRDAQLRVESSNNQYS